MGAAIAATRVAAADVTADLNREATEAAASCMARAPTE